MQNFLFYNWKLFTQGNLQSKLYFNLALKIVLVAEIKICKKYQIIAVLDLSTKFRAPSYSYHSLVFVLTQEKGSKKHKEKWLRMKYLCEPNREYGGGEITWSLNSLVK